MKKNLILLIFSIFIAVFNVVIAFISTNPLINCITGWLCYVIYVFQAFMLSNILDNMRASHKVDLAICKEIIDKQQARIDELEAQNEMGKER